nr:unnamed protein product [Callosobruchus chinensis]
MYAKGKGSTVPSDAQAREKLALYVYEYLLHVGAQKAAQTFLSEIRWEKNITLGEPPGFLHSWWWYVDTLHSYIAFLIPPIFSVFWDLYCAAPERRDTCEHSSEAKAFHDYGFVNSGYGVNGIAHMECPVVHYLLDSFLTQRYVLPHPPILRVNLHLIHNPHLHIHR